jgi:hypothetical protein
MSRDFQLTCNTASGHVVSSIVAVVRSDLALSIDRSGGNTVPVPEIRAGEVELALPESSRPRCWSSFPSPLYTRYTVHLYTICHCSIRRRLCTRSSRLHTAEQRSRRASISHAAWRPQYCQCGSGSRSVAVAQGNTALWM